MKDFELSGNQMGERDDEVPPFETHSETATADAQSVVSSLDAAVTPQADDPVPASESVQAETPLARYVFENKAWMGYLCIALGIGAIAFINSIDGRIGGGVYAGLAAGAVVIFGYSRAAKQPVFALYDDYLEFTPNFLSSPLHIPYAGIISVDMKRKKHAQMEVRRPDGNVDKKARVGFHHIRSTERDQAREEFRRKMEELGKLKT